MNFVFLAPSATPNHYKFCVELKKFGVCVLGLGDTPYDDLPHELKGALTEYYRVNDCHNYDDLVRAIGYFTFKYGKIDRLDSQNEYWLETDARLRTDFNIPGVHSDTIASIKRKSLMKRVFKKAEVAMARGEVIATLAEAKDFVAEVGFPVVAKPDIGVGALSTYKIHNQIELEDFFKKKPSGVDYIFEEFVVGDIVTFDGLTDGELKMVFFTSHVYSEGIMETVNEGRDIYYYSEREVPRLLETLGRRVVEAFGLRERFFHFEFFKLPNGEYKILEINMRPPGGYTMDMFNFACDIDLFRIWAEMVATGKTVFEYTRKYHCCYCSRKSDKNYKYTHNSIMMRYAPQMLMHVSVPGVFSSALGNEGYIYRDPDEKKILEIEAFIRAKA